MRQMIASADCVFSVAPQWIYVTTIPWESIETKKINIANKNNDFEFKKNEILLLKVRPSAYSSFLFWRIIPLHFYGERSKSNDIPNRMHTYRGKIVQGKTKLLSVQQLLYFPFKKAVPIIFSDNTF